MPSSPEPVHAFWRLRRVRERKGVTLDQLAKQTGLTKSYLSKVERGLCVPSIATALKLAAAFQLRVGSLFGIDEPSDDFALVRKNDRKPFLRKGGNDSGFYYEAIAPTLSPGRLETFLMQPALTLTPEDETAQHGGQEMLFVLKGRMEVRFPHASVVLSSGDTLVFQGHIPHTVVSLGKRRAEALVTIVDKPDEPEA